MLLGRAQHLADIVEKRKKLPVLLSKTGRRREIDVLITSNVAGYPVRFGIGCKNEANPLDTAAVDNFVRILTEVGIPLCRREYSSALRDILAMRRMQPRFAGSGHWFLKASAPTGLDKK
ncbi:hypothetical protein CQ10_39685 [Bradyrhizobium valentinum]|nr:hypothetical protein CQ10_39685 [Bradyrhizobium valentinum]